MNHLKKWANETHSVPLFQNDKSRSHIDEAVWKLGIKGYLKTVYRPFAFTDVNYFVQFLSFPRSGHSLIGSLLDAHPNAIVSHELDTMGLVHKGLPKRSVYGLIEINSDAFTQHGRFWNGFSYKVENQPHGYSENLTVIGDKKGDWAVRWFDKNPQLISKLHQTVRNTPRWILVTRNPMDNIATLSLRKNRTYDKLRVQNRSGEVFEAKLQEKQESGNIAASVRDDMISDYEHLCKTITKMKGLISDENILHIIYEDFCKNPEVGLSRICEFLDIEASDGYLKNCSGKVRTSLNKSRNRVDWTAYQINKAKEITQNHEFLTVYLKDITLNG